MIFGIVAVSALDTKRASSPDGDVNALLSTLADKVNSYQTLKEQTYRVFPPRYAQKLGLFRSDIRLNFHGDKLNQLFRTSPITGVFGNKRVLKCDTN